MTTKSSTAAAEAGTIQLTTGRRARARRWVTEAGVLVTYTDAAGRTRTAGHITMGVGADSFRPLTAEDIDRDHGVAELEAAGQGVRILTQITVDQHDAAFGDREWPLARTGEQLPGTRVDSIRVAIAGQWYSLTRVQMASGERRRFASQYNGYGDGPKDVREASMLFGCAWSSVPVVGWTEAEIVAEHEADAERMDYADRTDAPGRTDFDIAVDEWHWEHRHAADDEAARVAEDAARAEAESEAHRLNEKVDAVASVGLPMTNGQVADTLAGVELTAPPTRRIITAIPAGRRADGSPIDRRAFLLARAEPEPFGPGRARIFEAVWVPQLQRFDHHPHVVLTDSIEDVPPHAAGAGPAENTERTDPQT